MTLVTLDANVLPDYLLAVFDQLKRLYVENVKAKAMRNEIRGKKDKQIKMVYAKVALPQVTSFVTADFYQGKYTPGS